MSIRRILNLGAGTQSSVVLAMMLRGDLPPAELAIFSDTQWEPAAVYTHLQWLKSFSSIPIVEVTAGDLRADALRSKVLGKVGDGSRWASMPLYTYRLWQPEEAELFASVFLQKPTEEPDEWSLFGTSMTEGSLRYMIELGQLKKGYPVEQKGMIQRQCTKEYKIEPIRKWIKTNWFGLGTRDRWPTELAVEQVFGISFDERSRMRISTEAWCEFDYPLVDRRMSRQAVINLAGEWFLPLREANLNGDESYTFGMTNECEGMCGV